MFESTICTIASSFVSSFIITGMFVIPNALQASTRLCPLIISYLPAGKERTIIGSSNPFCAYIICRLNRQRGNCFKASVCIFEYKINLCSEQNPYAFCILGIYIYVAPPRTSFQYDFANDKKEKATLTKSEDCFQNNIHTHFCIRNLRIIQTGYSILPVPEKSVFPPWR